MCRHLVSGYFLLHGMYCFPHFPPYNNFYVAKVDNEEDNDDDDEDEDGGPGEGDDSDDKEGNGDEDKEDDSQSGSSTDGSEDYDESDDVSAYGEDLESGGMKRMGDHGPAQGDARGGKRRRVREDTVSDLLFFSGL